MCSFDLSGFAPIRAVAEGDDGGLSEHVIRTVSPNHVTFHLFDYWVNEQDSISTDGWGIQKGINEGHPFVFGAGAGSGPWNVWTGNGDHYNTRPDKPGIRYGEYGGIVKNVLTNGYPTLDLLNDYNDPLKGQPRFIDSNLQQSLEESLDYLFDPDLDTPYRAVYENVQGLLKYDNNGGYVYNSHENYAALKESVPGTLGTNGELSAGYFEVYDSWALMGSTSPNRAVFPL